MFTIHTLAHICYLPIQPSMSFFMHCKPSEAYCFEIFFSFAVPSPTSSSSELPLMPQERHVAGKRAVALESSLVLFRVSS